MSAMRGSAFIIALLPRLSWGLPACRSFLHDAVFRSDIGGVPAEGEGGGGAPCPMARRGSSSA